MAEHTSFLSNDAFVGIRTWAFALESAGCPTKTSMTTSSDLKTYVSYFSQIEIFNDINILTFLFVSSQLRKQLGKKAEWL